MTSLSIRITIPVVLALSKSTMEWILERLSRNKDTLSLLVKYSETYLLLATLLETILEQERTRTLMTPSKDTEALNLALLSK
jgi:hypothetical protein